jgi:predicted lysophospholipase L1 biosynthesis ABC-type transport system permease subunit
MANPSIKISWLVGAFALCFAVGGWIFCRRSYAEFIHTGPPWQIFAMMAVVTILSVWIIGIEIWQCGIVIGGSFPTVVLVRIILDCSANPTNHNLWPFELAIATFIGLVVAFSAAGVGWVVRQLL